MVSRRRSGRRRVVDTPLLSLLLGVLLPLALLPGPAEARQDAATGLPLWVVTHEGVTHYLLGSVHMLRPEVYPLDEALTAALQQSEVVAFELDFDELEASAMMILERGRYPGGQTLRDDLSEETYRELESRLQTMGVPAPVFESMKPWMATMLLSSLAIQEAGYDAESGVDFHFFDRAREAEKEIVALETVGDQIEAFEGLSTEAQVAFLEATLDRLDDAVERMDELSALWERGDVEGLADHLTESLAAHPELEERLLHARNRRWVPRIEELFDGPEPALVVVGMGHMVGDGSVIELLRERGHSVER